MLGNNNFNNLLNSINNNIYNGLNKQLCAGGVRKKFTEVQGVPTQRKENHTILKSRLMVYAYPWQH